jgi:hypothetical protein
MKKLIVVVFIAFLSGCGSGSGLNISAEFQSTFDTFKSELASRNVNIQINNLTIQMDQTLVGTPNTAVCTIAWGKAPVISVNPSIWSSLNIKDQEMVIFHELGHCILGRIHNDTMIPTPFLGNNTEAGVLVTCLGITYKYNQLGVGYMATTIMHPCSAAASVLYRLIVTDPVFQEQARKYYVDELINNRVVGFNSGF